MTYVEEIDLTTKKESSSERVLPTSTSGPVFNAFNIRNATDLEWEAALYEVDKINGLNKDEDRGEIKGLFWDLRSDADTSGFGFIVDVDRQHIAVPQSWEYPEGEYGGYRIRRERELAVRAANPDHAHIVSPILREGIKNHFKHSPSVENHLGALWQYYGGFCEVPATAGSGPLFCRAYYVRPELLRDGKWVFKASLTTKVLDGRTIADYYREGNVEQLAQIIRNRREGRLTRDNVPPDVNVVREGSKTQKWKMLALKDPEGIIEHANLERGEQKAESKEDVLCDRYKRSPVAYPPDQLRLILSSQDTEEEHRETILEPGDRLNEYRDVRNAFHRMEAYGVEVELDTSLVEARDFSTTEVVPPSVQVQGPDGKMEKVEAPEDFGPKALSNRARKRARHVREHGYVESTRLDPLLACPSKRFDREQAERLQDDLNYILEDQVLPFRFEKILLYDHVREIESEIRREELDALFAVLPEGSAAPQTSEDTHDELKRQVGVPSQCIQYDNTLHPKWVGKHYEEFRQNDRRKARRLKNRYRLAINSFLVKCHWVPFASADPFNYDVHVAIDVGGPHNNQVMACVGCGFSRPEDSLLFYADEIHTTTEKVEPIPSNPLENGLDELLRQVRSYLEDLDGTPPDFSEILFYRDGEFRGQGDEWHELDGLRDLHDKFADRGWIDKEDSTWAAIEVGKRAGHWRLLHQQRNDVDNPLVGTVSFPFENDREAIICTTGDPYLTQGTASPIRVRIKDVRGFADTAEAIQDLVWEADMCFTKPDMGMSLPWTLNVADTGALQSAKAYKINGITV